LNQSSKIFGDNGNGIGNASGDGDGEDNPTNNHTDDHHTDDQDKSVCESVDDIRPIIRAPEDPIWEKMYEQAQEQHRKSSTGFNGFVHGLFASSRARRRIEQQRERYGREVDIVGTEDDELNMEDKVLLLASRLMTNSESLPGIVYRTMIAQFLDRCGELKNKNLQRLPPKKQEEPTTRRTVDESSSQPSPGKNLGLVPRKIEDKQSSTSQLQQQPSAGGSFFSHVGRIFLGNRNNNNTILESPQRRKSHKSISTGSLAQEQEMEDCICNESVASTDDEDDDDSCACSTDNPALPDSNIVSMDDEENKDEENQYFLTHQRRRDARAIIKYVKKSLVLTQPGFGHSASLANKTTSAVECLVFGKIYGFVMEEIEAEYEKKDNILLEKITKLKESCGGTCDNYCTSQAAIAALRSLPRAHSTVDKLRYCVQFVERVSESFSSQSSYTEKKKKKQKTSSSMMMGADALLKIVCRHIVLAESDGIHAQMAFLQEFVAAQGDDGGDNDNIGGNGHDGDRWLLLSGREGYALVTLRASLRVLNDSKDLDTDIFDDDDGDHKDDHKDDEEQSSFQQTQQRKRRLVHPN